MDKQVIKYFIFKKIIELYPDADIEKWKLTIEFDCVIGCSDYYTVEFFSEGNWHTAKVEVNCVINTVKMTVYKTVLVDSTSFDLPVELRGDSDDD